jgi:hypothetical protein
MSLGLESQADVGTGARSQSTRLYEFQEFYGDCCSNIIV